MADRMPEDVIAVIMEWVAAFQQADWWEKTRAVLRDFGNDHTLLDNVCYRHGRGGCSDVFDERGRIVTQTTGRFISDEQWVIERWNQWVFRQHLQAGRSVMLNTSILDVSVRSWQEERFARMRKRHFRRKRRGSTAPALVDA